MGVCGGGGLGWGGGGGIDVYSMFFMQSQHWVV